MTTLTISNPEIENKYTSYEIKLKFIDFLKREMKEESVDLYEISVSDLSDDSKKRLENIDNLKFIDY